MEDSQDLSQALYEYLPLGVLVLESICAVLCNGAVLLLFCVRKSLLRTASDLFTINLSLVDLIFSGIVIPVVVLTALMAKNNCGNPDDTITSGLEVARNCVVLFGTVATALGTLLVSLDRGDVSLKPSKRFFTQSRAILAIGFTWCIAIIGLAIAILPTLLSLDKSDKNLTHHGRKSPYISSMIKNQTEIKYAGPLSKCCNPHPCNFSTINGCAVQLFFEIPIFVAAIFTIMIIYGKILWSVQQRSRKYMHGTARHSIPNGKYDSGTREAPRCSFCVLDACCGRSRKCPETPNVSLSEKSSVQRNTEKRRPSPRVESRRGSIKRKSITAIMNLRPSANKDAKKQDSLEDALFMSPSGKTDERDNSSDHANENGEKKSKTDFASVAMSVTVVLAIKRMAARKIKERKKKIHHLRKMTFFIIFTFLFCWSPYYLSKLSLVLSLHINNVVSIDSANSTIPQNDFVSTKRCTPGWIFTWMIAIAALSCILNPVLYMFSREKIRVEFTRMFFPSCCGESNGDRQRRGLSSCLLCWDADDNFKDRSPNIRRSVINRRWNEQARSASMKSKVELKTLPNQACSREEEIEKSNDNPQVPKVETRGRAPLLRWDAVECDTLGGSHDDLHGSESPVLNNGLLLPPPRNRPRSFSAKSVDVLSCSTTIASLAAEL